MISQAPGQRACPKCRSELPGSAAFCPVCGLQALDVCWECGEPLKGDWAFCPRCGTSAAETGVTPCPECREPVSRGQRYCPACGAQARPLCPQCGEIIRREWRFCPECGTAAGEAAEEDSPGEILERVPTVRVPVSRPSSPGADSEAAALNDQGVAAYEADRFPEAIRLFREAIARDSSTSSFYVNLAVALGESGALAEAIDAYSQAIKLDPDTPGTYLNLGYLYSELERYNSAREAWEQVIRLDPRSTEAKEARDNLQHLDEL